MKGMIGRAIGISVMMLLSLLLAGCVESEERENEEIVEKIADEYEEEEEERTICYVCGRVDIEEYETEQCGGETVLICERCIEKMAEEHTTITVNGVQIGYVMYRAVSTDFGFRCGTTSEYDTLQEEDHIEMDYYKDSGEKIFVWWTDLYEDMAIEGITRADVTLENLLLTASAYDYVETLEDPDNDIEWVKLYRGEDALFVTWYATSTDEETEVQTAWMSAVTVKDGIQYTYLYFCEDLTKAQLSVDNFDFYEQIDALWFPEIEDVEAYFG